MTTLKADPSEGITANETISGDLAHALDVMRDCGFNQLWVLNPAQLQRDAASVERARLAGWDIRLSKTRGGETIAPEADDWMLAYKIGEYTPAGYSLVFPSLSTRATGPGLWLTAAKGVGQNSHTLHEALKLYARALGMAYYRTTPTTGGNLLRALHSGPHALSLETPADMPPMARPDGATALQDVPIMWRRAVTEGELAAGPYFLSFDVNAQFLRASNGLSLGFGDVTRLQGDLAQGLVASAYNVGPNGRRLIPPGYYRVALSPRAGITRLPMPHPLYRAGRPDEPFSDAGAWVNAPTVRLLVELQTPMRCTDAYVWRESHRFFDPWYKRLNAARSALMADSSPAGALALAVLKQTYSHFFGALATERRGDKDGLKRPDWRHADISEARALHYRNMLAAVDLGHFPALVTEDTLGYLAPTSDPTEAAALLGLRLSDTTGHYKLKDCVDTRQRPDVRAALLDTAGDAKALQGLLARVRREMGRED